MRRRPTLRDVAAAAGVSTTTASLILNERPINVPPATRQRVLDAAAGAAVAVGCGGPQAQPAETTSRPHQKLEVWRPGAQEDRPWGVTIDGALLDFNKTQDRWEVEITYPVLATLMATRLNAALNDVLRGRQTAKDGLDAVTREAQANLDSKRR